MAARSERVRRSTQTTERLKSSQTGRVQVLGCDRVTERETWMLIRRLFGSLMRISCWT
jgi:hypothetical protein